MNGSYRYLHPLESVHDLLSNYPMRAEMSSVNFTSDPAGGATVTVQLREADPAVLAAGLVEWQRTLYPPEIWAWRNAVTDGVHIVVSGFGPECDKTPIAVLAGPIPHTPRLDTTLEPGTPRRLDADTLHCWPFQPMGATL